MLQRAKAKAQKALEEAKASTSDVGHGGGAAGPRVDDGSEAAFTHGGISKKLRTKKAGTAAASAASTATGDQGGPAFPTLGVTLDFLEAFTEQKVRGKPSRYCTAKVDCRASNPDELTFRAGEILGIADLDAVDDGWFVGYRRAGNWGDRLKFRVEAVDRLAGLSTDEVCGDIIKPETAAATWPLDEKERSYARMVLNASSPGGNARLVPAQCETGIGTANVFASHAWTFVFEELIQSLRFFEAEQVAAGHPRSYFWLDIFVVDENAAHTYPSSWWQTSFTEAVRAIGHTALVLTPWSAPVPLRRAWCLWEIYSTLRTEATLSVCMSDAETIDFHRALIESVDSVVRSLCTIDAETAEAGSQKDLDMIFAAVRTLDGGFQTLNVTVLQEMREWLLASISRALGQVGLHFEMLPDQYRICCSAADDLDDLELQEMFEDSCDCHDAYADEDGNGDNRLSFGNWYHRRAGRKSEMHICSDHYKELSRMQKRQFKAITCSADLGDEADMYKVKTIVLHGSVVPGKEEQAASILIAGSELVDELDAEDTYLWHPKRALKKALDLRVHAFGERDLRTAEAMHQFALMEDLELDDCFDMLAKALEIRKASLPQDHPDIGESVLSMARHFYNDCEDAKSALPFAVRAVKVFETADPDGKLSMKHVGALKVMANILDELGKIPESRECYEKAYAMCLKWHGLRHTHTAASAASLAQCLRDWYPHEIFKTVELRRLELKTMEVMAGMHNHETASCRENLAHDLQACCWLHDLRDVEKSVSEIGGGNFRSGDRAQFLPIDASMHRKLANLHGSWTIDLTDSQIKKVAGTEGTVTKVDSEGDVFIRPDRQIDNIRECCVNPLALKLVSKAEQSPDKQSETRRERLRRIIRGTEDDADDVTQKFDKWAAWRASIDPLPKLSSLLVTPGEWTGTEEEARIAVMREAEVLLLSALDDLEREYEYVEAAAECAKGLIILYAGQKRRKDVKAMQKRLAILDSYISDSDDSDDADDSDDDSDSDDGSDSSGQLDDSSDGEDGADVVGQTLELLHSMSPGLLRKLGDDSDEHVSVAELEHVLQQIEVLNTTRPPANVYEAQDRFKTRMAFDRRLGEMKKRDKAATLLDGGWKAMLEEGTPPTRSSSETEPGSSQPEPESNDCSASLRDCDTPSIPASGAISEGKPPVRDLQGVFSDLTLEPIAGSNGQPSSRSEASQVVATGQGVSPDELVTLADVLEHASPPTHGFGRAATTGVGDVEQAVVAFDTLLAQLGLVRYGVVLRSHAIVDEVELRDMTEAEVAEWMPNMKVEERSRWLAWRAAS